VKFENIVGRKSVAMSGIVEDAFNVMRLCVLASGLAVVYSTHLSRQLFAQLDQMQRETNELHMEWGQYLLERSTWSAFDRVENIASNRLNMHVPEHEHIVIVETSRK